MRRGHLPTHCSPSLPCHGLLGTQRLTRGNRTPIYLRQSPIFGANHGRRVWPHSHRALHPAGRRPARAIWQIVCRIVFLASLVLNRQGSANRALRVPMWQTLEPDPVSTGVGSSNLLSWAHVGHPLFMNWKVVVADMRRNPLMAATAVLSVAGLALSGCSIAAPVSYTHLTLPAKSKMCRSRWSPYH